MVDSLVVLFGLDPSGFEAGRKRVDADLNKTKENAGGVAKEMQAQGKKAGEFFGQIRNQIVSLFAVFTAGKGVQDFIRTVTSADAGIGRLTKTIGSSVTEVTKWQNAARAFSGDANGVVSSYAGIVQQFEQFKQTGEAATIPYFRALGVELVDSAGKLKSMTQLYTDLAAAIQSKKIAAPQAMALLRGAGIDDNTARMLIEGTDALKKYLAEAERVGQTNKADTDAAQRRFTAWQNMTRAFGRLGEIVLTVVSPALEKLMSILQEGAIWLQQHKVALGAVTVALAALFAAVSAAALAIPFAAIVAGFSAIAAVLGTISAPILAVVAAVAAAGVALAYLYSDWSDWNRGAASDLGAFWDKAAEVWKAVAAVATAAFNDIKTVAADAWALVVSIFTGSADDIRAAWAKLGGDLGNVWEAGWERGRQFVGWLEQQLGRLGDIIGGAARRGWTAFADFAKSSFSAVVDYIEGRIKVLLDLFPSIGKTAEKVAGAAGAAYDKAKDAASGIASGVTKFFSGGNKFGGATHGGQKFGGQTFGQSAQPPQIAGARAAGGPVEAGKSYLVGEKGPEVVNFGSSGTVIPNGGGNSAGILALTNTLAEAITTVADTANKITAALADQAEYLGLSERGLRTSVDGLTERLTRNLTPALARLSTALEGVVDIFGDDDTKKRRGEGGEPGEGEGGERGQGRERTPALPVKEQQARIDQDIEKLQAMGWTREQAIGIVSNLQAESGMNEKAVGDKGQAYGLAQWHKDRQAEFRKQFGKDIRDATHDEQLAFVDYELRHGNDAGARRAGQLIAQTNDSGKVADIFSRYSERPRAVEEAARNRSALAKILSAKAPPSVLNLPQSAPATAAQSPANDNRQTTTNTSTSQTSINSIQINTQATDAEGIARDLGPALQRFKVADDANYGIA